MVAELAETYDRTWSPVLETVRAEALDCVQANLAVMADHAGGPGTHLELGSRLRFDTEPGPTGALRVASSVPYRLAQSRETLGLSVARRWDGVDASELRALVAEHGPLYVIADAHGLGWTPYAGRRHTEHTFILSTSDIVVDAYHDETPWGPCRPGVWRLSNAQLDAMVPAVTALLLAGEPVPARADVLAANARAMADAVPAIEAYLAAEHADPDAVVLDIWLLGRSRLLHAAWLASRGAPVTEADEQAQRWLTLAAKSYVAVRRSRGDGFPPSVLTELGRLLHEDVALAGRLAAGANQQDPVRGAVLAAIRATLPGGPDHLPVAGPLRDLPGYNSFRLVEIIERIEARLGVELGDGDLTAETIRDVDGLCAAFARLTP